LIMSRLVPGLVGEGCRSSNAVHLPRWIHSNHPA
jgi:hypothetical protein